MSAFDVICCALLSYVVGRILVAARAQSHQQSAIERQIQSNHSSMEAVTPRRRRKKRNTARFIVTIVLFFLGCYVVVNYLVLCITISCHMSVHASQILILLLVLNSSVNPLVYACLKRDIKTEIKRLICRRNLNEPSTYIWYTGNLKNDISVATKTDTTSMATRWPSFFLLSRSIWYQS